MNVDEAPSSLCICLLQVLPPTDILAERHMKRKVYCADDSEDGRSFQDSLDVVGEGEEGWLGSQTEQWGEMPQVSWKHIYHGNI